MITALYDPGTKEKGRFITDLAEIRAIVDHGRGTLWIHLAQVSDDDQQHVLHGIFNFHPLAIEDTLSHGYQPPKVDDFERYIFLIIHAITAQGDVSMLETTELNCFLGPNYLVTSSHKQEISAVDAIWQRVQRDERIMERGADFLLHTILDAIVDEFLPYLDRIDDEVDLLEDQILEKPEQHMMKRILQLKHSILALRRVASPQREVMLRLSRGEFSLISSGSEIYFRDIYDHLVRINDISESVRDVVAGTVDTYLSVSSNKMNEIMKTLTIVSTIFMPMTLVTSLYGMNFDVMPELHWRYGYLMVWIVMGLILAGMLWFLRRHRWL